MILRGNKKEDDARKEVMTMLRRVLLLALLVVGCLAGLAITKATLVTQADSQTLTPCDFVERFKIVNRPTQIDEDDIPFIRRLLYDYEGGSAVTQLERNLPITSLRQLGSLEKFDGRTDSRIGRGRLFLLRIFYAFEDDEPCYVPSVQTGSSSLDQSSGELTVEALLQRVVALERQTGKLWHAIDDLGDDVGDLEDELQDLQDRVEDLEYLLDD